MSISNSKEYTMTDRFGRKIVCFEDDDGIKAIYNPETNDVFKSEIALRALLDQNAKIAGVDTPCDFILAHILSDDNGELEAECLTVLNQQDDSFSLLDSVNGLENLIRSAIFLNIKTDMSLPEDVLSHKINYYCIVPAIRLPFDREKTSTGVMDCRNILCTNDVCFALAHDTENKLTGAYAFNTKDAVRTVEYNTLYKKMFGLSAAKITACIDDRTNSNSDDSYER